MTTTSNWFSVMTPLSNLENQPRRIFEQLFDVNEELHGVSPIDDPVIVSEGEIHHRANLDLAVDDHRPLLDLVHAQDPALRRVQNRRGHQRAEDAAGRDRDPAAGLL